MRADEIVRSKALSPFIRPGELQRARLAGHARGVWLKRRTPRQPPTLFQRCLAVHIHNAGPQSALT